MTNNPLKDSFKLRLEDGTDVQYNSLIFTQGDDLSIPLTYNTEDASLISADELSIQGEKKRVPLEETEYITFIIQYEKDVVLKNVLTYIELVGDGNCKDIIIGTDNSSVLLESKGRKYCLIKELLPNQENKIRIAVQSDIEQQCILKLRPFNYDLYDTKWKSSTALFKDYPNIKISIDGPTDITKTGNDYSNIELNYNIENKSDISAENLKFQIEEPISFDKIGVTSSNSNIKFNTANRIITVTELPADNVKHTITITYKPTKKGVYDFKIHTLDNINTLEDDQITNSYTHTIMVDIISDVRITTNVSNNRPEIDELIDFEISFINRYKPQKKFTFNIADIGNHDPQNNISHYDYAYAYCENGEFKESTESNNNIGKWIINNIEINKEYKLILSLRPTEAHTHTIQTQFIDPQGYEQIFTNTIKVLEKSKKLEFNVHHAVNDNGDCVIDNLIPICDEDFITLSDDIYYLFEVKNNSNTKIQSPITLYARVPPSFVTEGIVCYSSNIQTFVNKETGLITIPINQLDGCTTFKCCIKLHPTQAGKFIANFMLSTRNSEVLHKKLILTVDSEFIQRELEHEINIYNFEKTNKYFRYEIDNNGDIFKFYNTGDKTLRPIQSELYDKKAIETYRGTNLKDITREIKEKSKYVDPVFLRIGSNKLKDKGYEIYPNGFMSRVGLLASEVFHYSNQLPVTTNLSDRVMKWNIDDWNTKVWAGDKYDNGIFDLTIDYDKVPSNFTILDVENPILNLQTIVDGAKPYGTKAICYYGAVTNLDFGINIEDIQCEMFFTEDIDLEIEDINILTTLNRHDKSLAYFNDDIDIDVDVDFDTSYYYDFSKQEEKDDMSVGVENVDFIFYDDSHSKKLIQNCLEILRNLYYNAEDTDIDITTSKIELTKNDSKSVRIADYENKHVLNQFNGYTIKYKGNKITFGYIEEFDDNKFILTLNKETLNERVILEEVENFSLVLQNVEEVLHFWVSINNEKYYHIGFIELDDLANLTQINTTSLSDTTNSDMLLKLSSQGRSNYAHGDANIFVTFEVSNNNNILHKKPTYIKSIENGKWENIQDLKKDQSYTSFSYDAKIDPNCTETTINIPRLMLKYDNFGIKNFNEITDIKFNIKAQSNKANFMKDMNINLLKDGDYYYPHNEIANKIYYPHKVSNTKQDINGNITIQQPNVTICGDCLKTALGCHEHCPYCNSQNISHYDEKIDVTVCENCGWVIDGTYDYCKHCLSYEVTNVKVDYNKTYCNKCSQLSNGYYKYCPHCFSSDTIYLDNDKKIYNITDTIKTNIDPIIIHTSEDTINIFNATLPFNKDDIEDYENLVLHIYGTNNNAGQYYYCEDCLTGGVGNVDLCPRCHSHNVKNYMIDKPFFSVYLKDGSEISKVNLMYDNEFNNILPSNEIHKTLDILDIAKDVDSTNMTLLFYVDYTSYNKNIEQILKLPIDEKYTSRIIAQMNQLDFSIDNLVLDYDYKNEKNWLNIDNLIGKNHTAIKYEIDKNETRTDVIKFSNFNIEKNSYNNVFLNLTGLCKTTTNFTIDISADFKNGTTFNKRITELNNNLFNYEINISEWIDSLEDVDISIYFDNLQDVDEIYITECSIKTEHRQDNIVYRNMQEQKINIQKNNDNYIIKSANMWGLKDTIPYYLSSKQLQTNMLCYIDFGKLKPSEYIRLYDIDMIIYYKTQYGEIVTETIPSLNDDNTEHYINADISKNNAEAWISITQDNESLNNLEYQNLNIDSDGELLNSIPLLDRLCQSFVCTSPSISRINFQYFGKRGYPNENIYLYLYDNYNNSPDNLIYKTKTTIKNKKGVVNIDLNINNLDVGETYWVVLEDKSADKNNYHRFNQNTNDIGDLIIIENSKKNTSIYNLCISIDTPIKSEILYNTPITRAIDCKKNANIENPTQYDEKDNISDYTNENEYKIRATFYRFNTNYSNNAYLSKLIIKNGRYYGNNN